ncbi:hypothetical protein Y1Q_0008478 [Alligator mississippiensis]|uniref:C-type lectin domain-containing protein n=1 Tax=Alligator mississippiensis TaxID=8496 RepID=A0A151M1F4_ALLMI|nr:hypothetical protein Y1Q_0008478 [Alligator mississippiensis]
MSWVSGDQSGLGQDDNDCKAPHSHIQLWKPVPDAFAWKQPSLESKGHPPSGMKCPAVWIANQDRSYLFSPEKGTWDQCKSSCISEYAKLLKIKREEELDFITATSFQYTENRGSGVYYYPFWTGLPYNSRTGMWVWADNSALSSSLFVLSDPSPQNYPGGACAYLQGDKVKPGDCGELRFCLCEKKKEAQGKKKVD